MKIRIDRNEPFDWDELMEEVRRRTMTEDDCRRLEQGIRSGDVVFIVDENGHRQYVE